MRDDDLDVMLREARRTLILSRVALVAAFLCALFWALNACSAHAAGVPVGLTALPNVSTACVATNPCLCPVYGPGGTYLPHEVSPGVWECRLALEGPGPVNPATPVPTLDGWALLGLGLVLAVLGARRLR